MSKKDETSNLDIVGKIFLIEDHNGKEITYEIVMPEDENRTKNKMSCSGPYGKAFAGKAPGDSATISAGGSHREVSILEIV